MGNFVPPAQTEDPLQTTDMEGLKGFDITSVQDPGFATVQKDRYTDGIVDGNFGGWSQVPIEEDTLGEATKSNRGKLGAVLYVSRGLRILPRCVNCGTLLIVSSATEKEWTDY